MATNGQPWPAKADHGKLLAGRGHQQPTLASLGRPQEAAGHLWPPTANRGQREPATGGCWPAMAVGGGIAGRSPKKRCRNMSFRLRLSWLSASEPSLHTIPGTHAHLPGSVADFRRFWGDLADLVRDAVFSQNSRRFQQKRWFPLSCAWESCFFTDGRAKLG